MAKYRTKTIAELAHQLKMAPSRLRLKQLDGIETLLNLIDADKTYPYDFVCYHVTGYRPKRENGNGSLHGEHLLSDLVVLAEELSAKPVMAVEEYPERVWSTDQLAKRLSVSTKTICRWRRRGLGGRKLRFDDGAIRIAFGERVVRRFVSRNIELVRRGAAFKQLTQQEKQHIVGRARELLDARRMRLHELSQQIAEEMGRAVETVRYTLRRYDKEHPDEALFVDNDQPAIRPEHQALFAAYQDGMPLAQLAKHFGYSREKIQQIIIEIRARQLLARDVAFIYSDEFDAPNADTMILESGAGDQTDEKADAPIAAHGVPKDLPPYLQDLYREPLLTPRQERDLFRRYNYLKYKAAKRLKRLEPLDATSEQLAAIEALLTQADDVKNRITRANLRLVVSIARRHVGPTHEFLEVVSDGNMSLMRAIEKFDYTRGFKFSTYASWAIMRNYARSIPEARCHAGRFVTSTDELLDIVPDRHESPHEAVAEDGIKAKLVQGLAQLDERERAVIIRHFGLGRDGDSETLDQIGRAYGVTKERIRQIERRAITRLKEILAEQGVAEAFEFA